MNKFDEQYYRVDFELSQLLKQANFKEKVSGWYNWQGILHHSEPKDFNHFEDSYSAPLIAIALEWVKEKGYFNWTDNDVPHNTIWCSVHYGNEYLEISKYKEFTTERERDLFVITTALTHLNKA
jgi:hypothetical protein